MDLLNCGGTERQYAIKYTQKNGASQWFAKNRVKPKLFCALGILARPISTADLIGKVTVKVTSRQLSCEITNYHRESLVLRDDLHEPIIKHNQKQSLCILLFLAIGSLIPEKATNALRFYQEQPRGELINPKLRKSIFVL